MMRESGRYQKENILKTINLITEKFLRKSSLNESDIRDLLSLVAPTVNADKAYIYEIPSDNHQSPGLFCHWSKNSNQDSIDDEEFIRKLDTRTKIKSWKKRLSCGKEVVCNRDDVEGKEKQILKSQNLISIVIIPVFVQTRWWGIIGVDETRFERKWNQMEMDALKIAGSFLGAMIERNEVGVSLKNSEMRYRAIVEDQTELIYRYKGDGTITFVNDAFCRYLKRNKSDLVGHRFNPNLPDEDKVRRENHIRSLSRRKPVGTIEYRVIMPKGKIRWQKWTDRAIFNSKGDIIEFQSVGRDITKERKLKKESEYRLQQVIQADKLASLGEVVAGVAHEINNPNSFIGYNIPMLEENWEIFEPIINEYAKLNPGWKRSGLDMSDLCDDMSESIRAIKAGSKRINKVVSNLKEFSKIDENNLFKSVDVNEVVEKALTIVGAQIRRSADHIETKLDDDLPVIMGNFQKLEQVVANLSVNAANALGSADKKKKRRISIKSRHMKHLNSVLIEIEDNGIGMTPEIAKHVFEPFFTTRRKSGGTGLGLSVSYGLIKEHNGTIGVISKPGYGSRFTIYLPVDRNKPLDLKPTLLCVDDDASILSMLDKYFVSVKNMPLETINNPVNVLDYLNSHPEIDIVISDILMPGITGWDLLKKIKKMSPLISVILYTGYDDAIKMKPSKSPMPDYFLTKPIDFKKLIRIINNIGRQIL